VSKQRTSEGGKNLISERLRAIREEKGISIRGMAKLLKEQGYEMDRNVVYRIEKNQRYVTDMEIKAFVEVLGVDYGYLIEGKKES